jgi:putative phosphoesterase
MRIGLISDSHDHLPNLRHALRELTGRGVKTVFHCGDLISPFVTRELGHFDGEVHTVFGNNDAFGFVDLGGHTIGFTHYKEYARGFAASRQCDAAFFGHTHQFYEERIGDILVLNPGEILGLMGKPSFCIYDTETRDFEKIVFDQKPW